LSQATPPIVQPLITISYPLAITHYYLLPINHYPLLINFLTFVLNIGAVNTFFFFLPCLLLYCLIVVYAERKISAFIQDRYGPMETGPYGILQVIADLLKTLQKEDITPQAADWWIHRLAPLIVFMSVFLGFSVIPLSRVWNGAPIVSGLYFLMGIVSIDVIGIFAAGWASNNKYSVMGAFRAAVQLFSYEVPLGLSALCAVAFAKTADLNALSLQQAEGLLSWNVFQQPLLFFAWIIFFTASLAECSRTPFDLPEAESELVAGFQAEYSGFRWAILMLSEYAMMFLLSLAAVILFWGSYNSPFPNFGKLALFDLTTGQSLGAVNSWGIFWLMLKAAVLVGLQIWVRWTLPRVRIDQLISICWKYLTPLSVALLLLIAWVKLL